MVSGRPDSSQGRPAPHARRAAWHVEPWSPSRRRGGPIVPWSVARVGRTFGAVRRQIVTTLAIAVVATAACGSGSTDQRSVAVPAATWALPVAAPSADRGVFPVVTETPATDPDGVAATELTVEEAVTGPVEAPDPCSLLDRGVFAEWVRRDVSEPIVLEHGRACGATTLDDTSRVAVMAMPEASTGLFTPGERARAEAVREMDGAEWVSDSPVAGSDQLRVQVSGGWQLFVEVSDRNGRSDTDRRDLAVQIALAATRELTGGDSTGGDR